MCKAFYFLQSSTNAINTINQILNYKVQKKYYSNRKNEGNCKKSNVVFVIGPYAHLGNFRTTAGCLLKDCQQ